MIKKMLLSLMLLSSLAIAQTLKVGDTINPLNVKDQFDKNVEINSKDYKTIIFSAEKDPASWVSEYLNEKPNTYLDANSAVVVSDISGMPSFVTKWFAMPKFKKYNYSLALIKEETKLFPKEEEALTIIKIKDNKIESIKFIKDSKAIAGIFN